MTSSSRENGVQTEKVSSTWKILTRRQASRSKTKKSTTPLSGRCLCGDLILPLLLSSRIDPLSLSIYILNLERGNDISEKFSTSIRELNRLKSWKLYSKHRGLEDNRIVPIRRARASYTKEPISISRGISDPSPPVQCMRQSNLLSLSGASILREAIPS